MVSMLIWCILGGLLTADPTENDYYRLTTLTTGAGAGEARAKYWKPGSDETPMEVSGIASLPDGRLAVAIRKGEVWILSDRDGKTPFKLFASGLHEPLGLLRDGDSLLTCQRSELTRLRDVDGDGLADEYTTVAKGWGVSGHYHEYCFGPKSDHAGNLWITLNLGLGLTPEQKARIGDKLHDRQQADWRGWAVKIRPSASTLPLPRLEPVCVGFRSPSGLGANAAGDLFATDQQGNWIPTCSLHHLRPGVFTGHPDGLDSCVLKDAPIAKPASIPEGLPYPEALKQLPVLQPPAVWFPYKKAGQSATDVVCDETGGKFGPFAGQLFVGEFTLAAILRVDLEKVGGEYQGACFPFRSGLASAVLRMAFADKQMFVGLSNRGWSSLGEAAYGLQRLEWTGQTPFEVLHFRSTPTGFDLTFTEPVDPTTAADLKSYAMTSYTYLYHSTYGSPEILTKTLDIIKAELTDDRRRVRLTVDGLRAGYVHELHALGLRSAAGRPLLHPDAYYTLNRIPTQN